MNYNKPHQFRYIGTNQPKKMRFLIRVEKQTKPLLHIYVCDTCQSTYESPLFFAVEKLNHDLTTRFPCLGS